MRWQPVTAAYPPDGVLVLTKVKRDRFNGFVRFLARKDNRWITSHGGNIGWHPTHWQVAEPERTENVTNVPPAQTPKSKTPTNPVWDALALHGLTEKHEP